MNKFQDVLWPQKKPFEIYFELTKTDLLTLRYADFNVKPC
jgi:hypothetical protein